MSLKKYIENKEKPKIEVSLDSYKETLISNVSGLILKPQNLLESKKYIIDYNLLDKTLSEMSYPFRQHIQMSLKTGDIFKINQAHKKFKSWAVNNSKNVDDVDNAIYEYQASLYQENLNPDNIDKICKSYFEESQKNIKLIRNFISSKLEKIHDWNNHLVEIYGLYPSTGFVVSEARVKIKDFTFDVEIEMPNFLIKNIQNVEKPLSLVENTNKLISLLKQNDKSDKILTLYMSRPKQERAFYESIKKEICLGFNCDLPNYVELGNLPLIENPDTDLWKIKIDSKYVYEKLIEGNYKQYELIDESPIRWIERINDEE